MKKFILGAAAIVLLSGCRVGAPSPTYSDGYRVGRVEKFSEKGFIYKSWEGRLILQGYDRDDKGNMLVRTFTFSVLPGGPVKKLEDAMVSGRPVKLHYHQDWMGQIKYDSSYFIVDVEPAS